MATTYTLLDKTILTGTQASISFNSLGTYNPDYTDLKIVISARGNNSSASEWLYIKFNSSSANYSSQWIEGNGSGTPGAFSGPTNRGYIGVSDANTATSNTFSNMEVYIPNFSSSDYKAYSVDSVQENNQTAATIELGNGLWSDTAAITSITIYPDNSTLFLANSSFYLYGISKS